MKANPLLDYCLGSCVRLEPFRILLLHLSPKFKLIFILLSLSSAIDASVIVISLRNSLLMIFCCQKYFFSCC
uniref:Uncharacterized protein n=1 Tax=Musa acuminata subsp. malaccensis TaxID=214687 RepID=A0A804J0P6_MUSAM